MTYILLPWAPPWMASSRGLLPPLERSVNDGWLYVHLNFARSAFNEGQATVNLTAALPSLHVAYPLMIALFFWRTSRWWTRVVLAVYPLLMAFSLVFGAEHYVVDILLGWVYAVLVEVVWRAVERRRGPVGRPRSRGPDRLASGVPMSTPRSPSHARFGYVPALDGLRALAVLSVMLYHGGIVRVQRRLPRRRPVLRAQRLPDHHPAAARAHGHGPHRPR